MSQTNLDLIDKSIIANISYKFSMYRVSGIMNKMHATLVNNNTLYNRLYSLAFMLTVCICCSVNRKYVIREQ